MKTGLVNSRFSLNLTFSEAENLNSVASVGIDVNSNNCDLSLSCWGFHNASSFILYAYTALAVSTSEIAGAQPMYNDSVPIS